MQYAVLTGMIIGEVLLVGGGIWLFRRFAKRRCELKVKQAKSGSEGSNAERLMAFFEFEINRMQQTCEDFMEGDPNRQAIERRLSVFTSERDILAATKSAEKMDQNQYAELISRYYRSADLARTPEFDKLQGAVAKYQQRIDNLEKFRTLFFRSQTDLADSVNRAVDLKRQLDQGELNDEQMRALVEQLKQEKESLGRELNIADHELEAIMSNMGLLHEIDVDDLMPDADEVGAILEQMRAIEEENEFLQVQIQHLLKVEVDSENDLKADIVRVTKELEEQTAKAEEMESKFLEMEARYLETVG